MVYVKKKLPQLTHDDIQAYILDPEHNPLPEPQKQQFDRVMDAARLLDDYPSDDHIIKLLQKKNNTSTTQLRRDIELAKQLYKTRHKFDYDFWHTWEIRDQLELIHKCKERKDLKLWNDAKKVLHKIIGEKPDGLDDPKRMEKNRFFIQVNMNGADAYKSIEDIHDLRPNEVKEIIDIMQEPIDDEQAAEIMDS